MVTRFLRQQVLPDIVVAPGDIWWAFVIYPLKESKWEKVRDGLLLFTP